MLRSMYSGISGMKNFQTKLDVIGNNIANVNTAGFKKGRVTFKDTMNQTVSGASASTDVRGGKNPTQVGLGSTVATIDTITTGSSLQTTNRPLDLGIDGDGYFIVKQGDAEFYTRAGNFYLDDNGTLVNADGLKVQAFEIDPTTGKPTNKYGDVAVNVNAVMSPTPTSKITIDGALSSTATTGYEFTQQIKAINSKGEEETIEVIFKNTSPNNWSVTLNGQTAGTLAFSGTNPPTGSLTWPAALTGYNAITFDTTKLQQVGNQSTALVNPNGNTEGSLESFSIGSSGEINGVYSNGLIKSLGVIALAKFSNSSGLSKVGNNLFQETVNSGTANIDVPGVGRGSISSGSLEMSNVDLSEEFTEMITAQRGFQANTRIITTSDEILQELVNLKR